jgi:N-dimethylarginine dimethylaminohydrolase
MRLINPTDMDLFAPQIHQTVQAFDSVEVSDSEAALFVGNSIFLVEADDAQDDETPRVKRQYTKRGSAVAEVDSAPAMETRG